MSAWSASGSGCGEFLNVALARFQHKQALRQEMANTRSELHEISTVQKDRKVIDHEKASLMLR